MNSPFADSWTISKQYADSSLLFDNTTKLWCTHQALDFSCGEGQNVVAIYSGTIEKIENSIGVAFEDVDTSNFNKVRSCDKQLEGMREVKIELENIDKLISDCNEIKALLISSIIST